ASRKRLPTRCSSSPPTSRRSSPATPSSSTAARPSTPDLRVLRYHWPSFRRVRMAVEQKSPVAGLTEEQLLAAQGDLREYLRLSDQIEDVVVVRGADPNLEMGALYELSIKQEHPSLLLFERIKGYSPDYRVV